jgi:hypothetical protein
VGGAAHELGRGEPGPDLLVDHLGGRGAKDRAAGRACIGDGRLTLADGCFGGDTSLRVQVGDVLFGVTLLVGEGVSKQNSSLVLLSGLAMSYSTTRTVNRRLSGVRIQDR